MKEFILLFFLIYQIHAICPDGYADSGDFCDECGISDVPPNVRIIGGSLANYGSWPSHVFIVQRYRTNYMFPDGKSFLINKTFYCAGTLINRNTVVTTASCAIKRFTYTYNDSAYEIPIETNNYYSTFASTFTVYLGLNDVSSIVSNLGIPPTCVVSNVSQYIEHYAFNSENILNDIALLILSKPVNINSYIKPACIPDLSYTYPIANTSSYAIGWGSTLSGGLMSALLRNVQLTVYSSDMCSRVYPLIQKVWESQICAGEYTGGKDTCDGDVGGGLYSTSYYGGKLRYMLAGLTSYGQGCALPNLPGIYTRVSFYKDWIISNWKLMPGNSTIVTSASTVTPIQTTPTSTSTRTTPASMFIQTTFESGPIQTTSKSLDLVIGLSVGIPLGVLAITGIVVGSVITYKKRHNASSHKQDKIMSVKKSFHNNLPPVSDHYLAPSSFTQPRPQPEPSAQISDYESLYGIDKGEINISL